ncbi:MAG: hypothetical protein JNJ50_25220, partial [Acidobacteria bacterium]|nr:hypothetical protein [Acidobacteriota bacterium]
MTSSKKTWGWNFSRRDLFRRGGLLAGFAGLWHSAASTNAVSVEAAQVGQKIYQSLGVRP